MCSFRRSRRCVEDAVGAILPYHRLCRVFLNYQELVLAGKLKVGDVYVGVPERELRVVEPYGLGRSHFA